VFACHCLRCAEAQSLFQDLITLGYQGLRPIVGPFLEGWGTHPDSISALSGKGRGKGMVGLDKNALGSEGSGFSCKAGRSSFNML